MKLQEIQKLTSQMGVPKNRNDPQAVQAFLRSVGIEPGELYQELEMSFRFVEMHQDMSFSNASVSLHSHSFYEILYCRNTCGAEYLVGAERYRLQKGDVIIIPPGVSHRPLLPAEMKQPYKRDVLWISQEFFSGMMQIFPDDILYRVTETRLVRTADTPWEFLGDLFRRGVRESEEKRLGWEVSVMGNTMQLIVFLRRAILDNTALPLMAEKPELLDQVLSYVENHLGEKITLSDVSRHFWVSQSTISQTFRRKMGVSFYRCVTQRRLIAAKTLILEGLALEACGTQVGFQDYSTFYRAFRQEYGISPRQYRKMQEQPDLT